MHHGDFYAHINYERLMSRKVGRPPKPARLRKTRRLQMLLTGEEHKKLTEYAQEQDTTISELMRRYIRTVIQRKGK